MNTLISDTLAVLDKRYPNIESWQRIVWASWMVNDHPSLPLVIVTEDWERFDTMLQQTQEAWLERVMQKVMEGQG